MGGYSFYVYNIAYLRFDCNSLFVRQGCGVLFLSFCNLTYKENMEIHRIILLFLRECFIIHLFDEQRGSANSIC